MFNFYFGNDAFIAMTKAVPAGPPAPALPAAVPASAAEIAGSVARAKAAAEMAEEMLRRASMCEAAAYKSCQVAVKAKSQAAASAKAAHRSATIPLLAPPPMPKDGAPVIERVGAVVPFIPKGQGAGGKGRDRSRSPASMGRR